MPRDADATRKRILDAAEEEFAAYGIAGARVDRIADAARANKSMIYRYFDSKDRLFDEVFTRRVVDFGDQVAFDAADLVGYAGRVFDSYEANPRTLRLTNWYLLERGEAAALETLVASYRDKLAAIERAQRDGLLREDHSPVEVLATVRAIAMSWHILMPEMGRVTLPPVERRREVVLDTVRRLFS